MQEKIVEYLKEKYKPIAIILHGSQARGKEREHSDWDFIFLYNSSVQEQNGREIYENQNIEFSSHVLPVEDIENEFSTKLQNAKVVYDEKDLGTALLEKANAFYEQGVHWSEEKIYSHKLWVQGRIDGMRDCVDKSVIFSKYSSDFYQRIFNYWYWLRRHSHSQPIYVAIEEIAEIDPGYYRLVNAFVDENLSRQEKVLIAEQIRDWLFEE